MTPQASGIDVRRLAARDSLAALTDLVQRAYAPLAERGLVLPEATQSPLVTQQRVARGQCFVATRHGQLVGTVTVFGAHELGAGEQGVFRGRDAAHLHQFAVAPELQRQGLGRRLVAVCEQWSRERGFDRLVVVLADSATDLQALYRRLGYVDVAQWQPPDAAPPSVVMEKPLDRSPLRDHLRTLARYNRWATNELLRHVQALAEADYRRDLKLAFRSVHGTLNHLLLVEHEVWYRRFAEGDSPVTQLDTEVEPDRAALSERLAEAALAWLPLIEVWPESRLLGTLSYRRVTGEAATLPFAAALAHVFNHGTHHRGQVSAALTALGRPAPALDLAVMLVQESPNP